jgi:hypothetical protein
VVLLVFSLSLDDLQKISKEFSHTPYGQFLAESVIVSTLSVVWENNREHYKPQKTQPTSAHSWLQGVLIIALLAKKQCGFAGIC